MNGMRNAEWFPFNLAGAIVAFLGVAAAGGVT
jgi:hypothetical protein